MKTQKAKFTRRLRWQYVLTDLVSTNVAWMLFNVFRWIYFTEGVSFFEHYLYPDMIGGQIFFPLMMMLFYWLSGYYNEVTVRSRAQEVMTTAGSALLGAIFIFFLAVVNDSYFRRRMALESIFMAFICIFICVYLGRFIVTSLAKRSQRHSLTRVQAVMVGTDADASKIARRINNAADAFAITTFVRLPGEKIVPECTNVIDRNELLEYCHANNISHLVLTPSVMSNGPELAELMRLAQEIDGALFVTPDITSLALASKRAFNVVGEPLVCISSPNISDSSKNIKRLCDIVLSSFSLILLSPIMAYLAVRIKLDSTGPILFRQQRLGLGGKPFEIIKFRSMVADAEKDGKARVTVDDDPRITRFGSIMRKYHLDELPQFWNVLLGEMSIVGPRPERQAFAEQIAARVPLYPFVYQVRPGITSWGMVRYGYASNVDQMVERLRYDLIYLENISIITDIKILLHTISTVISGKGK